MFFFERMRWGIMAKVTAISRQLFFRKRFRSANGLAGDPAAQSWLAPPMLHGLHLHVVPVRPKRAENPSVVRHITVPIGGAFPDAHCRKMRRLKRRHMPLVDRVVGDAVEADLAGAPGLDARPLDTVVKIFGLARRKVIDVSGRAAAATRVYARADVIVGHPLFRIDDFPVLILVA